MSEGTSRADGGRVVVDEDLPSLEIPRRVLNELYQHALETLPEECCGLIVGGDGERFRTLTRCRNEMTQRHLEDPEAFARDGRNAFYMSPLDYMRVHEKAEAEGDRVTVVYHSHVGAGAYLSEMDREHADSVLFPFPDADHIVVAVVDHKIDSVAYFRREPDRSFAGRTIVSSAQ
jgi:proteasome lid subunit RPN8/RPN11